MLGSVKYEWNNNITKQLAKKSVLIKKAILIGSYKAVDELAEIGMEEVRKSQSYHDTEKLPTKIVGDTVKGGYINRTKGISYAEYGTGVKATTSHNKYPANRNLKIWFTRNPRAEKYYKKRINKHTGEEYYVVFPQKAQRRFFFAKKAVARRRNAVISRNIRRALREAGK